MSVPGSERRGPGLRSIAAAVGLALLFAWAAVLHYGLGPRPDLGLAWWSPRGFLTRALLASPFEDLLVDRGRALTAFVLPSVAIAVGVWLAARSALVRAAALAAVFASAIFVFFAIGSQASQVAWNLFRWRASATMLACAALLAGLAASPWLAASWLRRGWAIRLLLFLPVAFVVIAVERNVTGTNPRLPFALSPWPAVQVFALEVAGTLAAAWLAGAALGLLGVSRIAARRVPSGLLALALGLAIPAAWLALGSRGVLPFHTGPRGFAIATACCALAVILAALPRPEAGRLRRRGRVAGTAALLVGLPLLVGEVWARVDYTRTRDVRAERIIEALQRYYEREGVYPDSLEALVQDGDLDAVPRPAIGFAFLDRSTPFTYQAFGTSYLLEFPAPRWVQCAYNPPYADEEEEGGANPGGAEDNEDLGGAWSCPSSPPELW